MFERTDGPSAEPVSTDVRLGICPECGYVLNGLPSAGQCPECGWTYNEQTHVWKTLLIAEPIRWSKRVFWFLLALGLVTPLFGGVCLIALLEPIVLTYVIVWCYSSRWRQLVDEARSPVKFVIADSEGLHLKRTNTTYAPHAFIDWQAIRDLNASRQRRGILVTIRAGTPWALHQFRLGSDEDTSRLADVVMARKGCPDGTQDASAPD